ncbi:hypothetical protein KCV07_g9856, partial [Aureobasidium melanogenum]
MLFRDYVTRSYALGCFGAFTIAQSVIVEVQPIAIVCSGSVVSTTTRTSTSTISSGSLPGYSTTSIPGVTSFSTVTGPPTTPGGPSVVTVYYPSSSPGDPGYYTTLLTSNVSKPFTSTGTPLTPGGSTPVYVITTPPANVYVTTTVPGGPIRSTVTGTPVSGTIPVTVFEPSSSSSAPAAYLTTTVPGGPIRSTVTGTPVSGTTPVTVFVPPGSTTITTSGSSFTTVTGTPDSPSGVVTITVFTTPSSNAYSTTSVPGNSSFPYAITGTPSTSGGTVPVTVFTPPPTPPAFVTTTEVGSSTVPYTVTRSPTSSGATGTVIVFTPPVEEFFTTTTQPGSSTVPYTVTEKPATSGGTVTVIVYTPSSSLSSSISTAFSTTTEPGSSSVPYTVTGTASTPGGTIPVTVFTPPPTTAYSTATEPGSSSVPYTVTGTASTPGGTIPVTVFTPPPTTAYSTTTEPGNSTVPYTTTGSPSTPDGTVPVTVYTPPVSTAYSTTTEPGNSTVPYTVTGTPLSSGGTVPVTVYTPTPTPVSTAYSTTTEPGNSTVPYTVTGTPSTPGGTVPVVLFTPTPSPSNIPNTTCNNRGLAYAVYNNPYTNAYSMTNPYASFDATYFQTAPVEYQNTTTRLGYSVGRGGSSQVYGKGPVFSASNITINHRGYLYAKESGNYTFSAPSVDDILLLWLGNNAYNTYTRGNADLVQNYINPSQGSSATTYTAYLTEGTYTPFRFIFANAQQEGVYALNVTAPDGSEIIDSSTTQQSPYLVQFSCDCSAPEFPPFGNDGPGSTASATAPGCQSSSASKLTSTTSSSTSPTSTAYSTTTVAGSSTEPYTVTGTPSTSSGTVPVTVFTPTPTPFSCDAGGYLIQDQTLSRLNLSSNVQTTISTNVGNDSINAMGYNVLDNYLYAIETGTPNRVIRIDSAGKATTVGSLPAGNFYNVGDFDGNGNLWISAAGEQWARIELTPGSTTFGHTTSNGTSSTTNLNSGPSDWVYLPQQGEYFYSVTQGTSPQLVRWSLTTHTWSVVRTYGNIDGRTSGLINQFGALYAVGSDTFYASDNGSGALYRFNVTSGNPTKIRDGSTTTRNDGARCILADSA